MPPIWRAGLRNGTSTLAPSPTTPPVVATGRKTRQHATTAPPPAAIAAAHTPPSPHPPPPPAQASSAACDLVAKNGAPHQAPINVAAALVGGQHSHSSHSSLAQNHRCRLLCRNRLRRCCPAWWLCMSTWSKVLTVKQGALQTHPSRLCTLPKLQCGVRTPSTPVVVLL